MIELYVSLVDTFLADLKHVNNEKFSNLPEGMQILFLIISGNSTNREGNIIVRVPVIPGFNFTRGRIDSNNRFCCADLKNASEINFIPFHTLAKEKYQMLGRDYPLAIIRSIEKSELESFAQYAEKKALLQKS